MRLYAVMDQKCVQIAEDFSVYMYKDFRLGKNQQTCRLTTGQDTPHPVNWSIKLHLHLLVFRMVISVKSCAENLESRPTVSVWWNHSNLSRCEHFKSTCIIEVVLNTLSARFLRVFSAVVRVRWEPGAFHHLHSGDIMISDTGQQGSKTHWNDKTVSWKEHGPQVSFTERHALMLHSQESASPLKSFKRHSVTTSAPSVSSTPAEWKAASGLYFSCLPQQGNQVILMRPCNASSWCMTQCMEGDMQPLGRKGASPNSCHLLRICCKYLKSTGFP